MIVYRGEAYSLPMRITTAGFDVAAVASADFNVGGVIKHYPSEVSHSGDTFYFPMAIEDTMSFDNTISATAFFNFANGTRRKVLFGDLQVR